MYVSPNFKTKKDLKAAVESGKRLEPYNPSGMFPAPTNGQVVIEGPHYPQAHKWYANCKVENGIIVGVK
jgi:hypothetical protein